MYEHIYGILPPVTTPFWPDNTIDEQALVLHEKLLPIWNAIYHDNLPANVKFCMELLGRPAGGPRPPMPPTSDAQAGSIRQALKNAGLLQGVQEGAGDETDALIPREATVGLRKNRGRPICRSLTRHPNQFTGSNSGCPMIRLEFLPLLD